MTADAVEWLRCPRTRSRLSKRSDGALVAAEGGHVYPLIAGIYDFRLFDPPYMTREDENRLALQIEDAAQRMDQNALIEHYEAHLAVEDERCREHIAHRMALLERAPRRLLQMLRASESGIPRDGAVLDLGCGSGEALGTLMDEGASRVVGIDISLVELVLAKSLLAKNGREALLVAGCAEALPFADGVFDFVYSPDVIEHVSSQSDYVGEAYRVLKLGGKLLLNSPNRYSVLCPEPHVGLWFLTFLPRALIDPVCRLAGKGPYVGKRLVSLPELRRLVASRFSDVIIKSRAANPRAESISGRLFYWMSPYSERALAYVADQHVVVAQKHG